MIRVSRSASSRFCHGRLGTPAADAARGTPVHRGAAGARNGSQRIAALPGSRDPLRALTQVGGGSAVLLVLERERQLRAVGDRPALIQVDVLLNDLSYPEITDGPGSSPDRLRRRIFP